MGGTLLKTVLYTTHCPQCHILEQKMKQKNISYEIVTDINIMKEKGFLSAPMLEVNGLIMNYKDAYQYISTL